MVIIDDCSIIDQSRPGPSQASVSTKADVDWSLVSENFDITIESEGSSAVAGAPNSSLEES